MHEMNKNPSSTARPPWMAWSCVAAVALALRLSVAPLDLIPDECVYIQHAWNLARGELDLSDTSWYVHRLPVYLPTGVLYSITGVTLGSTLAWPLLAAMIQLVLAMVLTLRLAGRAASIVAGTLLAVFPLDVVFSIHLMPDVLMGSAMSASVVCWWLGLDASDRQRRIPLLTGAGLLLGLATLIRPYALVLGIYFLGELLAGKRPRRHLLPVGAGLGVIVLAYLATYQLATGNPLHRLEVVANTYGDGGLAEPAQLLFYPRIVLEPRDVFGLHAIALLLGLPLLLRQPRPLRLLAWLAFAALFLEFGSMSLEAYLPILKRARFLTPLGLPLCVLLGIALARAGSFERPSGRMRRTFALAVVVLLVTASALHLRKHVLLERPRYFAYATVAETLLEHPELPVMVDHWRTAVRLGPHVAFFGGRGFYFGDSDEGHMRPEGFDAGGRLEYLDPTTSDPSALPPGFVLIDRADPQEKKERVHRALGLCGDCGEPGPELTLLFQGSGLELYAIRTGAERATWEKFKRRY